jgi:hypothetical protein
MVSGVAEFPCLANGRYVNDQRIIGRTSFEFIYSGDSLRTVDPTGQPIDRLGRNGHNLTVAKQLGGTTDRRGIGRQDHTTSIPPQKVPTYRT